MYNGRDGVVTDDNGLIYMRARYYSPELRRFINADIIAGKITNAITLNRYAYANANPVSNIDPFGLEAKREQAAEDLTATLDLFNTLFASSQGFEFEIPLENIRIYNTYTATSGIGNVELQNIINSQKELLKSVKITADNINVVVSDTMLYGVEYSSKIDEYNTISASISLNFWEKSASVEYTIKTQSFQNNAVSSTFGIEINTNSNISQTSDFEMGPAFDTVTEYDAIYDSVLLHPAQNTAGLKVVGVLLLIYTIGTDVLSFGAGITDDLVTIPAAMAMICG